MREKKGRALMAAATSFVVLCLLLWVGCLPDLTPFPRSEAGVEGGTIAPQNVCGDGIIATLDDGGDAGESCDPGDATVIGCRSCRIECEGTSDPATGHCYFALPTPLAEYKDADDACRQRNAHVVTLASPAELTLVSGIARGQPYWVGLVFDNILQAFKSAVETEPGVPRPPTSGPCEGCFAPGTDGGDTLSDGGSECVVARSDVSWQGTRCKGTEPLTAICEREPDGKRATSCSGGFCFDVLTTAGKKRYLLGVDRLTAAAADATCRSLDDQDGGLGGSRLAIFSSVAEREEVAREIVRLYPPETKEETYWIGLVPDDAGSWIWEDGEPVTDASARRAPWGDKQPALFEAGVAARAYMRIAVTYDIQLAYADDNASSERRYICERRAAP